MNSIDQEVKMRTCQYRPITSKKSISPVFLVIFAVLTVSISWPGITWGQDITVKTGLSYHWWDSTNQEKGQQFYVPVDMAVKVENYSLRILTGYMYSYYDGRREDSHDLADLLDTKINLSARGETIWGINWLAGLDMNLPTGKTDLGHNELSLLMDPDLVPINTLGEGFNLNPVILLAHSWDRVVVGLGAGYDWRDKYDFSTDFENYDPGDIWRVLSQIRWQPVDGWTLHLKGGYTWYGTDQLRGHDYYQPGDMFNLAMGLGYEHPRWKTCAEVSQFWRDKDRLPSQQSFHPENEERNGYGDETLLRATATYHLTDATDLCLNSALLWIQENDYSKNDPWYYRGERRKLTIGLGMMHSLNKRWTINTSLSGFTMHDDETPEHPDDERSYKGFGIDFGLSARF
jgi:hypothetical protein